ncbi:MAG TPA: transposase, partial [Bryobacteraceae bacterium]
FNGRLRDECLNVSLFFSLADVREQLRRWQKDYNHLCPHSSLDDIPHRRIQRGPAGIVKARQQGCVLETGLPRRYSCLPALSAGSERAQR